MELLKGAKAIRLRGHHEKYLVAEDDEEHVCQDRNGVSRAARWTVEFVPDSPSIIRLKSCYGRYLTASNVPFLLGVTGRKVLQTLPQHRLDSSTEWEPVREGFQLKLKTRYGHFLRANGGLPPWRNSVTHDTPHRTATQDWVLWDVDVVDLQVQMATTPAPKEEVASVSSPSLTPQLSKQESLSPLSSSPHKMDGRTIYYKIADGNGNVREGDDGSCFHFKGTSVAELTEKLEEETEISGIFVCSRNPLNDQLYPLRLHLPPNNTMMKVVVVPANSKVARNFKRPEDTI